MPLKEYPYWRDTLYQTFRGRVSQHSQPEAVDVAVIGAGYTGLAAARHLASCGASVVVCERDGVGSGASSRNAGQVLTGLRLDPATLVAQYGAKRAAQLFDVSRQAIAGVESLITQEKIDAEFERTGHLQAAAKPAHFKALRDEQRLLAEVFGHRVEVLGPDAQRTEIGTDRYHGVLIDEASGSLNPARFASGLADAAERAGAAIQTDTPALRIDAHGAQWRVTTPSGPIEARDLLVATDAYTGALFPPLNRRLITIGSYIIATEPLNPAVAAELLPRRRMAFDSKHFLFYFRLTPDQRLLFGGRAEFSTPSPDSTRRAAAILVRGMTTVFPQVTGIAVEYAWSGAVAFARDQMPHAGRLDGAFYAAGYAGHGIAMATHLGELIARRLAGEPIEHPLVGDHFDPIPLYDGRAWFLPLVGAYYKMKDWLT